MRKALWLSLLLCLTPLHGQVFSPSVIYVTTAPSGACTANPPIQVVISTGVPYTCNNGTWGAAGGSGGATLGANTFTGIQSAPGFAGTGAAQTVVYETQGTAAAAAPANTIRRGAPLTVPFDYDLFDPILAPTAPNQVIAYPNGGGTGTFVTPAEVLIQSQTLGSAAGSMTFSSIPGGYTHLRLVGYGASNAGSATSVGLTFNGDTAGHYAAQNISGTGSTVAAGSNSAQTTAFMGFVSGTNVSNVPATYDIVIPGYANTTFNKLFTGTNIAGTGSGTFETFVLGGSWASTAAITSLTVTPASSNNWVTGTTFSLYGVN